MTCGRLCGPDDVFRPSLGRSAEIPTRAPYLVFHDGYQYFEARYGLTPVGALAVSSAEPLNPRAKDELRARITASSATCVLFNPPVTSQAAAALIAGTQAHTAMIEALGMNIPPGSTLYQTVLARIATTLVICVAG